MKNLNKILYSLLLIFTVVFFIPKESSAEIFTLAAPIDGGQEVPPNLSTGLGNISGTYNDVTRELMFRVVFTGLLSPTTAAHLHAPAPPGVNAPVVIGFVGFPLGVFSGAFSDTVVLTVAQNTQIIGGLWYVNIHTNASPGGEIRGQLAEGTLPVELSSFTSYVNKNNVKLNWSTANETNNAGFEVERKQISSTEWTSVGYISGNGNTVGVRNFTFTERVSTGNYNYRLKQIDFNGTYEYFNLANEVIVGVPSVYNISQNYPNPFNPSTKIDFEIPNDAIVNIVLFDISGREVSNLVNERKTAGFYTVQLNASNLPSGTYFYKISAQGDNSNFVTTKKMTLIK